MNKSDTAVIDARGLSKAYNGVKVLDGLNLRVPRNSIFGFLGPNGAGKTTTIKLLLGLIQPTGGTALVFGGDIRKDSVGIRRRIGYLAQEPHYYSYMTARQILRYTAHFFYSGPRTLVEDRVSETLQLVGLEDKADRPVKGFSGGERQRLGIGQAQVNYPDLLILDEPAASLDPQGRHDVLSVMERLRKYTTIFYSTHILDDVQRVSDTVAILNKGKLVAEAPIEQMLAGGGAIIYTVAVNGNPAEIAQVEAALRGQPWVRGLSIEKGVSANGTGTARPESVAPEMPPEVRWQVSVTDEASAEAHLLRSVLASPGLTVAQFGRKTYELEDIFLSLVERSNHDGR